MRHDGEEWEKTKNKKKAFKNKEAFKVKKHYEDQEQQTTRCLSYFVFVSFTKQKPFDSKLRHTQALTQASSLLIRSDILSEGSSNARETGVKLERKSESAIISRFLSLLSLSLSLSWLGSPFSFRSAACISISYKQLLHHIKGTTRNQLSCQKVDREGREQLTRVSFHYITRSLSLSSTRSLTTACTLAAETGREWQTAAGISFGANKRLAMLILVTCRQRQKHVCLRALAFHVIPKKEWHVISMIIDIVTNRIKEYQVKVKEVKLKTKQPAGYSHDSQNQDLVARSIINDDDSSSADRLATIKRLRQASLSWSLITWTYQWKIIH